MPVGQNANPCLTSAAWEENTADVGSIWIAPISNTAPGGWPVFQGGTKQNSTATSTARASTGTAALRKRARAWAKRAPMRPPMQLN